MTDWDMEVLARADLTPLEKLVYHLPWYDKGVSELARDIGMRRDTVAKCVAGLVTKELLSKVRYGAYQPKSLPEKCGLRTTPMVSGKCVPETTPVACTPHSKPESVACTPHSPPNININKVLKYFNILEYRIEDEKDRKRYNRCLEWLAKELTEDCTSPDLLHRASLAFAHGMIAEREITQILNAGKAAVAAGKAKFLCAYFAGSLKRLLLGLKVDLGTCRTKRQISQGVLPDYQARFDFGNPDLPGQRHFPQNDDWKGGEQSAESRVQSGQQGQAVPGGIGSHPAPQTFSQKSYGGEEFGGQGEPVQANRITLVVNE